MYEGDGSGVCVPIFGRNFSHCSLLWCTGSFLIFVLFGTKLKTHVKNGNKETNFLLLLLNLLEASFEICFIICCMAVLAV